MFCVTVLNITVIFYFTSPTSHLIMDPNTRPSMQQVHLEENKKEKGSRRSLLECECDEDLGENATYSAVLYCNLKHPELKQQYPGS